MLNAAQTLISSVLPLLKELGVDIFSPDELIAVALKNSYSEVLVKKNNKPILTIVVSKNFEDLRKSLKTHNTEWGLMVSSEWILVKDWNIIEKGNLENLKNSLKKVLA